MIITKNHDGTFNYSGYAVDACQYMAELFHFKYVFYTSWYITFLKTDDNNSLFNSFSFVHTRVEDLEKFGPRETEANFLLRNVYLIFLQNI